MKKHNKNNFIWLNLKYKIKSPYIFDIISNKKTKIKISYEDNNGKRVILCNKIIPKGTLFSYPIKNKVFFELWNAKDVTITIKNESDLSEIYSISKHLSKNNYIIDGSYNHTDNELNIDFYNH